MNTNNPADSTATVAGPAAGPSSLEAACLADANPAWGETDRRTYAETVTGLFREFNVTDVTGKQLVQRIANWQVELRRRSSAMEEMTRPRYNQQERQQMQDFVRLGAEAEAVRQAVALLEKNQPLVDPPDQVLAIAGNVFVDLHEMRLFIMDRRRRKVNRKVEKRRPLGWPNPAGHTHPSIEKEVRQEVSIARRAYGTHVIRDLSDFDRLKRIACNADPAYDRHRAAILAQLRVSLACLEQRLEKLRAVVELLSRRGAPLGGFGRDGKIIPLLKTIEQVDNQIRRATSELRERAAQVSAAKSAADRKPTRVEPAGSAGTADGIRRFTRRKLEEPHMRLA